MDLQHIFEPKIVSRDSERFPTDAEMSDIRRGMTMVVPVGDGYVRKDDPYFFELMSGPLDHDCKCDPYTSEELEDKFCIRSSGKFVRHCTGFCPNGSMYERCDVATNNGSYRCRIQIPGVHDLRRTVIRFCDWKKNHAADYYRIFRNEFHRAKRREYRIRNKEIIREKNQEYRAAKREREPPS